MRTLKHNDMHTIPVELEGAYGLAMEAELHVRYTFYPECKGSPEYRGGPPMEPDEPAHVDITDVTATINGVAIPNFTSKDYDEDEIKEKCLEHALTH
ncbi:hypothetical protein [Cupriavidus metallidurans]